MPRALDLKGNLMLIVPYQLPSGCEEWSDLSSDWLPSLLGGMARHAHAAVDLAVHRMIAQLLLFRLALKSSLVKPCAFILA